MLAATREHRAAAVTQMPAAARKTFTLREFARLVAAVDPASLDGESDEDVVTRLRDLVDAAAAHRGQVRPASPADDDVADPYRRPIEAFRAAAQQLDEAVRVIAAQVAAVLVG